MYPRNSIIRQRIAIQLHHYVVKYKIYIVKKLLKKNLCTTTKHMFWLLISVTIVMFLIIFCMLLFDYIQLFIVNSRVLNTKYEMIDTLRIHRKSSNTPKEYSFNEKKPHKF